MQKEQEHVNILVADPDSAGAEPLVRILRSMDHACTVETDFRRALDMVRSGRFDVVVANLDFGGEERGLELLNSARSAGPEVQFVLISDQDDADTTVTAMNMGATDFLHPPVNPAELSVMLSRAARYVALERDKKYLQRQVAEENELGNIVGNSRPMRRVFDRIRQAAATDATVLILGETGTGKELVARAIHFNGDRRNHRFVPLNCAGLVETLLESELFGHEKGAFTGATTARVGMFEHANNGTLFLDEIGDMPLSSQVKLLRVLERNEIVRVGSNEPVSVDVRVVAATHQDLSAKVKDRSFREDLFYRLNVVSIRLPPLRERREDILLLTDRFLKQLSEQYDKSVHGLGPEVRKILYRYDWPGNVRELRNCLEHMVVLSDDCVLTEYELPDYLSSQLKLTAGDDSIDTMAGQPLDDVEKVHIGRTLKLVDGNREKAADLLGIGERTLYRKIRKYDLG